MIRNSILTKYSQVLYLNCYLSVLWLSSVCQGEYQASTLKVDMLFPPLSLAICHNHPLNSFNLYNLYSELSVITWYNTWPNHFSTLL
jgi:hypothetical protein